MKIAGMKICLVTPGYQPEVGGGIGTYASNLATALVSAGHSVHVIAKTSGLQEKTDTIDGVRVHRLRHRHLPGLEPHMPGLRWSASVSRKIEEIDRSDGIDIIEFPNWEGPGLWYLLKRRRRPAIVKVHTPYFETLKLDKPSTLPNMGDRFVCWQEKQSCLLADGITSSTEHHRQYMARSYDIDPRRIEVIPLGIRGPMGGDAPCHRSYDDTACRILYLSRLESRKGTLALIDAIPLVLERHPRTEFVFVGEDRPHAPGDRKFSEYLRERFPACLANVRFVGYVPDSEVPSYYRNADLFVVPSNYESFGLVFVEAMFYGLPVVGGRAGGIPEVIDDNRNGLLVELNSCHDVASKIIRLIEDPALRRLFGTNGLLAAQGRFHAETMARKTEAFYRKIIERASKDQTGGGA
jgi:glycosyltransferase involved in cell wall biosynthesis